jgi:prevent-host-death family protein
MNKVTHIPMTDAKAQLTELVRRAEAGDEVILTRHGQPAVRLVPVKRKLTPEERGAVIDRARKAAAHALPGPCAARSQDFLYDEHGLPK